MYPIVLFLCFCRLFYYIHAQAAVADGYLKMDDLVEDVKNKPIGALINDLTKKATGEFDKMYHKLENVLGQLAKGTPEEVTQLDPRMISDCNCYCRCPHKSVNSKVVDDVKNAVLELKKKVENVGKTLKDKIHQITSHG